MEPQAPNNQNTPNINPEPPIPPTSPEPAPIPDPAPSLEPTPVAPVPEPTPAPAPAPESQPTPTPVQPEQPTQPTAQSNKKQLFLIIGIAVAVITAIAVTVVVFLFLPKLTQQDTTPTLELAEETCTKYGGKFDTQDVSSSNNEFNETVGTKMVTAIGCMVGNDSATRIAFEGGFFENNISDASTAKKLLLSFIATDAGQVSQAEQYVSTLEENSDFYKGYFKAGREGSYYFLAAYKNAVIMLMSPDINTAEDMLTSMGFPDRSHADANAAIDDSATSELQVSQDNTQIRNDIANVATNLTLYRSNNNGQIPAISGGYVYVDDTTAIDSGEIGVFYDKYLNGTQDFVNPLGDKYALKVYGSLAAAPFASDYQTLKGASANEIYIVYGAECGNNELFESSNPQSYAILSPLLGEANPYCTASN